MASRRNYITIAQVTALTGLTVTDAQISAAEELIDAYVGAQHKAIREVGHSEVSAATPTSLTEVAGVSRLAMINDYYKGCEVEIVGGHGAGQIRQITGSDRDSKTITVDPAWDTTPDVTSVFRIYQLAKFPRRQDRFTNMAGDRYYGSIPDAVREAVAAQLAFADAKGADFFNSDGLDMQSESIGNYSYSKGNNSGSQSELVRLVAPRARQLLRGITNRTGRIVVD